MKASTQYDDYVGTCAADISDHKNLTNLLSDWGVSTERFYPVGVKFYCGETGQCNLSVLCNDKESHDGSIAEICYVREPGYSIQDVMSLFKRFQVIMTSEGLQDRNLSNEPAVFIE
ncbi:MAG: hypothetical protein II822_03725 [Prevotella sp.]|nr:hypothetical protein [Prevotella sp.]